MLVKERINVNDDRLVNGLLPVIKIMSEIDKSNDIDFDIDLSEAKFISPVFALSLIVFVSKSKKCIRLTNETEYIKTIELTAYGMKSDQLRGSQFLAILEKYSKKTFVPIVDFPARTNNDDKETILSAVERLIINQLSIQNNVAQGIKYIIGETIDNISEHSESDRGYIFAQAYPKKRYLDLCIADRGITLLGSYTKLQDNTISSDLEAIRAANRGISSKNLPEAENRGFGIYTTKKMLVDGLGGQYLMISGGSLYMKGRNTDNYYDLPPDIRWDGTIIALRIPYEDAKFNYIKYIE